MFQLQPQTPTVTIENLPSGDAATWRTLERMAQAVRGELPPDFSGYLDERLRQKAVEITRGLPGHDFGGEVAALFAFVRDGVKYRRDPVNVERIQDAQTTLRLNSGDCDDKCILLATLLAALGWLPRFVVQMQGSDFDHVFLEVFDERANKWIALDPTADGQAGLPHAPVGWRNPAQYETPFEIFGENNMAMRLYGMGEFDFGLVGQDYGPDYNEWVNRGIDVLGAWASRSPYISPSDPRYRANINVGMQPSYYPQQYPAPVPGVNPGADVAVSRSGLQLSTPVIAGLAAAGGLLLAGVLFGKRGR